MQRRDVDALLPAIYQDAVRQGSPLDALLEAATRLPEPEEAILARLDALFDPRRTPDAMVAFLAGWVDLDRFLIGRRADGSGGELPTGMGRLRELCANAAELSRYRGTRQGLIRFLEVATGESGFRVQENQTVDDQARPFHLCVIAPKATRPYAELIHAIVAFEKPAYVTYDPGELRFE